MIEVRDMFFPELKNVLPILKDPKFRNDTPLFFKERLINDESSPVIAYGTDLGNSIAYFPVANENELIERMPQLRRLALDNLKKIEVEFRVEEVEGLKLFYVSNTEYTSEKILDTDFMKAIAEKLNTKRLLVGIPFKTMLIGIDANSPNRLKFPAIVKKFFDNPRFERICENTFYIEDGKVVGIEKTNVLEHNKGFGIEFIKNENGQTYYILQSLNIEQISQEVNLALQHFLVNASSLQSFPGDIKFILSEKIQITKGLLERLNSFVEQIDKNELYQTLSQTILAKKSSIRFEYKKKIISPIDSPFAYSDMSDSELYEEFYRMERIFRYGQNQAALNNIQKLAEQFVNRKLPLPGSEKKKWWQFWK